MCYCSEEHMYFCFVCFRVLCLFAGVLFVDAAVLALAWATGASPRLRLLPAPLHSFGFFEVVVVLLGLLLFERFVPAEVELPVRPARRGTPGVRVT